MAGVDSATALQLNTFINVGGLCDEDKERLARIGPKVQPFIAKLTDRFYEQLESDPLTGWFVEGRVEQLKVTHLQWLEELFAGDYGEAFVHRQGQIGRAHVKAGIPPLFVAASMSYLRSAFPPLVEEHCEEHVGGEFGACIGAVMRMLDFCQFLIDRAYEEDRMQRLCEATGMSRKLLENLVKLNAK